MIDADFATKFAELEAAGEPGKRDLWEHIKANGGMKRVAALVLRGAGKRKPRAPALFEAEPKKATRWPADKPVPPDWLDSATARRTKVGLPAIDLRVAAEEFVMYWSEDPHPLGKRAFKVNWKSTFERRCLTARAPMEPYSRFAVIAGGKGKIEPTTVQGWVKRLEIFHGLVEGVPGGDWQANWGPIGDVPPQAVEIFERAHGRRMA